MLFRPFDGFRMVLWLYFLMSCLILMVCIILRTVLIVWPPFSTKNSVMKLASILRTYLFCSLCHLYCNHYTTTIGNECANVKVVLLLLMLFFSMPFKSSSKFIRETTDIANYKPDITNIRRTRRMETFLVIITRK